MNTNGKNTRFPEINTVVMSGRLTRPPEVRETKSGKPVGNFRIASNRRYRSKDGEWNEETTYVDVVAWNPHLCERISKGLIKGSGVVVEGHLQSRDFVDSEGISRHTVEINADRVQFVEKYVSSGDVGDVGSDSDDNDTLIGDAGDTKPF